MYLPAVFQATDERATAVMAAYPLAQVVVHTDDGLMATPVPLISRDSSLVGHLTKANPLCGHGGPALAIFSGADAYVSPSLYPTKAATGKVVPTWNYETVQVRGTIVFHDDPEWKLQLVTELTNYFEHLRPEPWAVTDAPADYIDTMLRAIVGIELTEITIVGKSKLSQNRTDEDRQAVQTTFATGTPTEQSVADVMGLNPPLT